MRAAVTSIPDPVAVGIDLIRVGDRRAVVVGARSGLDSADVSATIPIAVLTGVTRVPQSIRVRILLGRVRHSGAIVAGVAKPVPVGVHLIRVGQGRAIVSIEADAVLVRIALRIGGAGIADVPETVPVDVELIRVRARGAVVAGVPQPVAVRVDLVRVAASRTVVDAAVRGGESRLGKPVAVQIRAVVLGVRDPVGVPRPDREVSRTGHAPDDLDVVTGAHRQ